MAKKKTKSKKPTRSADIGMSFRFRSEDRDTFRRAMEIDGFNSLTAWMLFHLRRIAKETIKREGE